MTLPELKPVLKEANGFASPSRQLCLPKKKRHHAHSMPINTPQINNLSIQIVSENKKAKKKKRRRWV